MGFVSEDDFNGMKGHCDNVAPEKSVDNLFDGVKINRDANERGVANGANPHGRMKGDRNIPPIIRDIVAVQAQFESAKDVANAYGIGHDTVALAARGHVNSDVAKRGESDRAHKSRLDTALGQVRDKAIDRIMHAMGCMTDEKFEDRTAKELSLIVGNLAGVVRAVMPKDTGDTNVNFQTLFYTPEPKKIEQYQVLDV